MLPESGGVYLVATMNGQNPDWIDCGQSGAPKDRVRDQDREECWERHAAGKPFVFFVYFTDEGAMWSFKRYMVEQGIRAIIEFACGKRRASPP
jgi:hypothetical protein